MRARSAGSSISPVEKIARNAISLIPVSLKITARQNKLEAVPFEKCGTVFADRVYVIADALC